MSAEQIKLNTYDQIIFFKDGEQLKIKVNGNENWMNRNEAHLLMLWLQEHLK